MQGIISVYKPKGPTSHDVIQTIRKVTGVKKVGHAGTLDPLARGVLVIGIGREATRELSKIVVTEKEYIATIRLGVESTTDDEEGEKRIIINKQKLISNEIKKPTQGAVKKALSKYTGFFEQIPPVYSAIKIKGTAAYARIRRGENVVLASRRVYVKKITLLKYEWPYIKICAITGSGVYIRALARDIGNTLLTGGYLTSLERVRVGEFTKKNSISIKKFIKKYSQRAL